MKKETKVLIGGILLGLLSIFGSFTLGTMAQKGRQNAKILYCEEQMGKKFAEISTEIKYSCNNIRCANYGFGYFMYMCLSTPDELLTIESKDN